MNKFYTEFEEQEENKLSYMNIFKEYTKTNQILPLHIKITQKKSFRKTNDPLVFLWRFHEPPRAPQVE